MRGAKLVLLDRPKDTTPENLTVKAVQDLSSRGVEVVVFDQGCGLGIEKKLEPPSPPSVAR